MVNDWERRFASAIERLSDRVLLFIKFASAIVRHLALVRLISARRGLQEQNKYAPLFLASTSD